MKKLIPFIIMLAGCQKSSNNNPSSPSSVVKLPIIMKGTFNSLYNEVYIFHYDNSNRLLSFVRAQKERDSLVLTYNSNGTVDKQYVYELDYPNIAPDLTTFTYSTNTITEENKYHAEKFIYTVDAAGHITSMLNQLNETEKTYYDGKDNISKVEHYYASCSGGLCYTETFQYDTHPGIFSNVYTPKWCLAGWLDNYGGSYTVNNTFKALSVSTVPPTSSTVNYTIVYDSDGYPISIKASSGGLDITIEYEKK